MSNTDVPVDRIGTVPSPSTFDKVELRADKVRKTMASRIGSAVAIVIALLWTVPTIGLLITSFRPEREIKTSGWWTFFSNPTVTTENYVSAMTSSSINLSNYFINSLVITIPSVLIPITIALLAAYAFAWLDFKGRSILFVGVFTLQVVPIQVTLIPLLTQYVNWELNGSFWVIWLSHSIFALPLAIFLLHNFMTEIPRELVEAARVDGAGHVKIFFSVLLPLLVPAIASFAIFQFLWVWNDLLVALTFAGGDNAVKPLTVYIADLSGTRGADWHLLSAAAFISMIVPVIIFVGLQRYFVRGLLAGSVTG